MCVSLTTVCLNLAFVEFLFLAALLFEDHILFSSLLAASRKGLEKKMFHLSHSQLDACSSQNWLTSHACHSLARRAFIVRLMIVWQTATPHDASEIHVDKRQESVSD
jgi:hypothetical protein